MGQPPAQQRAHLRAAAARPVALLLALSFALFIPAFVFRNGAADLLPFTPKEHPHGAFGFDARSAVEYVKALLLRRPNPDVFRLSVEVLLAATVLSLARFRAARVLPWLFGALYAGVLLFITYHHAFARVFESEPAVWEDSAMLINLFHYLSDRWGGLAAWAALAGGLAAVALVAVVAGFAFRALHRFAWSRRAQATLLALSVWGVGSALWFGVDRDDPVVQVVGKRVVRNVRASLERRARLHAIAGSVPDRRYDALLKAKLRHKPRVHLIMFEAYGHRLAADPEMKAPYQELMRLMQARLSARGLAMRTALSDAPVFGGRSWLSIATVQTGIKLDQPSLFAHLEKLAARITTLTDFFHAQGYRTLSLQPGNRERVGVKNLDLYRRDVVLNGPDLDYRGTPYNQWGWVPDQYSLGRYREQVLSREAGPVFSFFMNVSTHHPWNAIPFVADWHQLNDPAAVVDVPLPQSPRSDGITAELPRRYFEAVVYDWRALADFIEAEASDDAIFFIVGDHQPLLERTTSERILSDIAEASSKQTMSTPVHVLSRDVAFVQRFEKYGLVDGLFTDATTATLKHEGLFSLFVTELVSHHGELTEGVQYLPDGVGLAGLSVR